MVRSGLWLAALPFLTAAVDVEIVAKQDGTPSSSFPEDVTRLLASVGSDPPEKGVVVRSLAGETEFGAADRMLSETRANLDKERTSVPCAAPPGGFEPGDCRVEVVAADGSRLAEAHFAITVVGAPAAAAIAAGRVNLAAAAAGGRVRVATSQSRYAKWQAGNLIDGLIDGPRKDRTRSDGWSAGSFKAQELVLSFYQGREATIDGVVLDPRAHDGRLEAIPKLVEVWSSNADHPTDGFTRIASARLARQMAALRGSHGHALAARAAGWTCLRAQQRSGRRAAPGSARAQGARLARGNVIRARRGD